jgi:hypothetical protein
MPDLSFNGNLARNALVLAVTAAGLGWFVYARRSSPAAGSKARLIERAQGHRRPPRIIPSKIAVAEPMAGYGA